MAWEPWFWRENLNQMGATAIHVQFIEWSTITTMQRGLAIKDPKKPFDSSKIQMWTSM